MDVGIVTPRYPPTASGGGEISVQLLAEHLVGEDQIDDLEVFSFDGRRHQRIDGVPVRRIRPIPGTVTELQNLRAYRHLRSRLDAFDMVHAYNMELHPVVGLLTDSRSIPSVATLNSYHFFPRTVSGATPRPLERIYERIGHPTTGRVLQHYVRRIDRLVAISSTVQSVYVEQGYDSGQIEVIPNMLDPGFSVPDVDDRGSDGDRDVLYVGRLEEIKGLEYLIRAVGSLPQSYSLRIVGDGSRRMSLETLVHCLELGDRVTFTGRLPYEEIPAEYARADVFVHPGTWPEPFGRTVLEAMQAGLPVVCTDVGGPADLVRDAELRVPPGDPTALAGAIEAAGDRGATLGERNREYVRSRFAPRTVISRVLDCYESVRE